MSESFRTATGRVVRDGDNLLVERRPAGPLGTLRDALVAADVPLPRRALTALVLLLVAGGLAELLLSLPLQFAVAFATLLGLVAGYALLSLRRLGAESVEIPTDQVRSVRIDDQWLTRPRVVLEYDDAGGVKHRVLRLPPRLYGTGAPAAAREMFSDLGLWAPEVGEAY